MLILTKCTSIRETNPNQLHVGSMYFADADSLYYDGEDSYVCIYKDIHKKEFVGNCKVSHFDELEEKLSVKK